MSFEYCKFICAALTDDFYSLQQLVGCFGRVQVVVQFCWENLISNCTLTQALSIIFMRSRKDCTSFGVSPLRSSSNRSWESCGFEGAGIGGGWFSFMQIFEQQVPGNLVLRDNFELYSLAKIADLSDALTEEVPGELALACNDIHRLVRTSLWKTCAFPVCPSCPEDVLRTVPTDWPQHFG